MRQIPQLLKKTGISQDYSNQYVALIQHFNKNNISKVIEIINKRSVKKYAELFPPDEYIHDYDEKIKRKIEALDEFAKIMNKDFSSEETFDKERFKEIINEVYGIIYGEERKIYQ